MASKTAKKKYSSAQLLKSNQFSKTDRYLMSSLLKDDKYTLDEVKKIIEKESKRGVK